MKNRIEIKLAAVEAFKKQYWVCVGWFLLSLVIIWAAEYIGSVTVGIASLFVVPHMVVGQSYFGLKIYNGEEGTADHLFIGFKNYARVLGGMLYMYLFIFLWSLLLIIPGIIKMYAYSMTPFILVDQPDVSPTEALKLSMKMTYGYKADLFIMYLSFIGWGILSALTFGIVGIFYANPYFLTTNAGYYQELKTVYAAKAAQ